MSPPRAPRRFPFRLRPFVHLFILVPLVAGALLVLTPPSPVAQDWFERSFAVLGGPVVPPARDDDAERQLSEGIEFQRQGRFAAAIDRYRSVLARPESEPASRNARFLLGEALYLDDRDAEAIQVLESFVERYPDDPRRLAATGIRAKASQIVGDHVEAIRLFREYRAAPNAIDGYLALELGESLAATGNFAEATAELNVAASAGLARISTIDALEKLADVYAKLGDQASVARTWGRIAPLAQTDAYLAEVRYRQALALVQIGRNAEATTLYVDVMRAYGRTGWGAAALREGAKTGVDPGPYQRGIILYYADREAEAVTAFTEFLTREPGSANVADALLHRGLSHRYLGAPDRAAADFERAGALGGQRSADEALYQAGQMFEALGRSADSAPYYRRLVDAFPASTRRDDARFRLALVQIERQDLANAQALLTEVAKVGRGEVQAAANLWLGKLAAGRGDRAGADAFWRAAEVASPMEFYGLRARALRNGEQAPQALVPVGAAFQPDDPADLAALDRWVGALATVTVTVDLRRPGPALLAAPGFRRGDELLRSGFYRDAIEEFRDLAVQLRTDPISLYQLALWLDERDLARATAYAGEQLVAISPSRSLADAPRELLQLVMPTPYRALVEDSTRRHGVDPALLMALMRQESAYDRYARSVADARGLTQVMPSTAEGIARNLGQRDFAVADLYRPETAIEFGAFYLAEQLKRFSGNAYLAMGAYNAGPGAIPQWTGGGPTVDSDLFVERITYRETASYVRLVGKYYYLYRLAHRE
ncbi:MAG: transglycosylase SLT domain-containing protein [Dehalococcoidia bacterium]